MGDSLSRWGGRGGSMSGKERVTNKLSKTLGNSFIYLLYIIHLIKDPLLKACVAAHLTLI